MRSKLKVLVAVFLMAAMVFTMFPASAIAGPKGKGNRKPGKTVEETQAPETEVVETEAPTEEVETETVIETEAVETEAVETVQETEPPVEETEVAYPAQTFEGENKESGISVTVDAPEGALPAGTEMKLTALTKDQLAEVSEKVDGNLVEAIDISFWNDDQEIEPLTTDSPIIVTMSSAKIAEVEDLTVVHIPDDDAEVEEVKQVEDAAAADEVVFEADSFSVYAVVETIIDVAGGEYLEESEGVSVSVITEDNTFAEPVLLTVEKISEASDAFDTAVDELGKAGIEYDGMVAYDIHFTSVATGAEVEPSKAVDVKIEITDAAAAGVPEEVLGNVTIAHIFDDGGAEVVATSESAFDENTAEDDTIGFQADEFSTYTISWSNNRQHTTVHYGYLNGSTFVEFDEQPSPVNVLTSYRTYLIYDFDEYEYSGYTYYRTSASTTPASGGTRIQAQLRYSNSNWRYHNYSTSESSYDWHSIANNSHIYVIYNKRTDPVTGGTPVMDEIGPEDWPQSPQTPQFYKNSTNNGDGTNTVALSISGGEKEIENSTKANVIVVFDVSGSMSTNLNGQERLVRAKTAVNTMANTLLNTMSGVKMALVSFSTTATTVQGFTDNYNTYSSAVNGLRADGGTNWEQALSIANRMTVDSDAATFVVFVTDGDPTYRLSRYDASDREIQGYNRDNRYFEYNIFGEGTDDTNNRNFDAATEEVSSILENNKNFYAIGVSSDVTKVRTLVTEAGGSADHAFLATDSTALENAFSSITQSIKTTLGFGDVEITDGITELANVEMKVMQEVDPDSFTYYKITSSGQTEWDPTSEGANLASYNAETGAVTWDMGENFQLEDGVTYMVTFRVWPSQEAYDLVADLNNGVKVYASGQANSITDEERAQVVELAAPTETTQGSYTLKTNTDSVSATYSQTSSTGDTVTVSGQTDITATYHEGTMENMALTSQLLTIRKVFEDDLTAGEDRATEVTLVLKRKINDENHEFEDYNKPGTSSPEVVLNDDNNWTYTLYVAPGFIVDGEVLEKGYQFTVTEPDIDYHYDLIEESINPMVVDGTLTLIGDTDANQALTAINRVKSGIDIKKIVVDPDGKEIQPEGVEFTITGQILDADGNPFTFDPSWDDREDKSTADGASAIWQTHQNDPIAYHMYDANGNRIVYKGHFASTGSIEFTLKAGESVRFINVPEGCTFEFDETQTSPAMPSGFEWKSTTGVTQHRTEPNGPFVTDGDVQPEYSENESKVSLPTGVVGNKQYAVTFTNKSLNGEWFYVYHSSNNKIEKIFTEDDRVDGVYDEENKTYTYTFNIVDETLDGHLYGGYFKAYGKAGMTDDEIVGATYTSGDSGSYTYNSSSHPTTGMWTTDSSGTPYTGSVVSFKNANAYTASGASMKAVPYTVYYLKEVPDQYFRPATYVVWDTRAENHDLKKLHMLSVADDSLYKEVGLTGDTGLASTKKMYTTFKVTNDTGTTETIKVSSVNRNLPRGFLTVWDATSIMKEGTYTANPYFITKDGITVTGVVNRTITVGSNVSKDDFATSDSKVDSTYSSN